MIKAILVFNHRGKVRLSKFYEYYPEDDQQRIINETFQLVASREDYICNFVHAGTFFVEALDKYFETVCELDLIFNIDKVHYILNELVMGGLVLETNPQEILARIAEQSKLEKKSESLKEAPIRAAHVVRNKVNLSGGLKEIKSEFKKAFNDLNK